MVRLNPRSLRVLNQDGASDMMHSVEGADHVGSFLREARENAGSTVADIARNLRIRRVYLEAIEDGRFDELPGATYAIGFVRSYAAYLGLDAPVLVERFKEEASGIQAPQDLDFPTPVPEGRFPGGLLVTICLLLAGAAFGGWYWYQSQNGIEVARVPSPPAETAGDVPAPEPSAPAATADPAPEPTQATVAPADTSADTATETAVLPEHEQMAPPPDEAPLVPPSYLEPQVDPLASMADVPALEQREGATVATDPVPEAVAPDAAADTPAGAAEAGAETAAQATQTTDEIAEVPATREPDVTAVAESTPETAEAPTPAEATADETPTVETPTDETAADETAAATPTTPVPDLSVFNSEPAIIALPGTSDRESVASAEPAAREGRTFGARNAAARIILQAQENTWVQVREDDESVILTQMLEAGDRYMVPKRDGLRLMTGNAGGLEILVDG
ncbi:MAG: RodZ domain-containing protein, partial [Rhodospirillaceae bacterium]